MFDPTNPYVLGPHLCAAAAELPLTEDELDRFGPSTSEVLAALVERGLLRRRPGGWFWTRPERASDLADLRGIGGGTVRVVEDGTGRMLGTVDPGAAHTTVHAGAVYVHQGETYVVDHLDLDDAVAVVHREDVDWTTSARETTDIRIVGEISRSSWGDAELVHGARRGDQPGGGLPSAAISPARCWARSRSTCRRGTCAPGRCGGPSPPSSSPRPRCGTSTYPVPLHAAEHASIGLLPLFATCDRWDIGGVSTALHADTGRTTVFVYDGHPGGAGFAERGFTAARTWLTATREAIASCECPDGCPSCVQSPKCGNGNDPLDKAGAVRLLDVLLSGAPDAPHLDA